MLFKLKQIFAESGSLEKSIPQILHAIGDFMKWDIAFYWTVDYNGNVLKCHSGWKSHEVARSAFEEFEKVSLETRFNKGTGLPGRVWANSEPSWIVDVTQDKNFPRLPFADKANIHSGFGFPVFTDEKIFGVIEVFTRKISEPDPSLSQELANLGSQIGQFAGRKFADAETIRAKEEAEKANRTKSEFLSSMSHELRTPLNAILGFADLLKGLFFGKLNEKQLNYVSQIDKSGKHLLELINDILELSKIDAGKVQLNLETFSLKELLEETLELMRTQFNKNQLEVKSTIDPTLKTMTGDRRRCKQIMLNLLSNAVKYTPEKGRIEVAASVQEDNVHISVSDTGVGIRQEDQEKIFSEFYQADRARDEALGGTGIGLALTRRLVELHGGEIGVESDSTGTTFWFNLPHKVLQKEDGTQMKEAIQPQLSSNVSHRILVVEDNEVNLTMILDMLRINDHKVCVARNGQEAIDLAQSNKPELILMDIRMPVMDGFEATRRLRQIPEFAQIPIIALTASVGDDSKEKCVAAGCTEHLSKPIQSKELFAALYRNLKPSSPRLGERNT